MRITVTALHCARFSSCCTEYMNCITGEEENAELCISITYRQLALLSFATRHVPCTTWAVVAKLCSANSALLDCMLYACTLYVAYSTV